jgi:fibronectin type 3 domain-containing protein
VGPLTGTGTVKYTDTALIAGDSYSYRVAAINTGGKSGYSNTVTLNVPAPPAAPTNLSATLQTGPQALLTWTDNANNETGFVIERGVNGGAFTTLTTTGPRNGTGNVTYTDNNLTTGNTYSYRVAAINGAGMSSYSNTTTVNVVAPPSTPPTAPSSATVTATQVGKGNNARITLTWTASSGATGYTIQVSTNNAFTSNVTTATAAANATSWSSGNLSRATAYYVRIQAFNGAGPSITWTNATPFPITTP